MSDLQIVVAGGDRVDDIEPVYRSPYAHHVAAQAGAVVLRTG